MKNARRNFVVLAAIAAAMLSFITLPGGEFYRISLNGKQVIEHFLARDKGTPSLNINSYSSGDKLSIYYYHCGQAGTGRHIALKDEDKTLKRWSFNNGGENMILEIKELIAVAGKSENITLVYSCNEIESGRTLANVEFGKNVTAGL